MYDIEILKNILLVDHIEKNIKDNENLIFDIIPMLKYEKDFNQKNKWHSYDVWNHTIKAVALSNMNFENRLVLLLHDIGKPFSYQDEGDVRHFKGHALKSKEISKPILEKLGYKDEKLDILLFLIGEHATQININNVNKENVDLYNRLLDIQFCDAGAYEPMHAKNIIEKLTHIRNELLKMMNEKNDEYEK